MVIIATDYISVGGNRYPAAADWDAQSGLLAFGADNNVALWEPTDRSQRGVYSLLVGHTDKVSAVRFFTCPSTGTQLLFTGSVDRIIHVWRPVQSSPKYFAFACKLGHHEGAVNSIAVAPGSDIIASGAADGTVKIWRVECQDVEVRGTLLNTISMKPRYFPLAMALRLLETENPAKPMILAVAGTTNIVQIYAAKTTASDLAFQLCATLSGHEAWVRSLAFIEDSRGEPGELLLASASQDKYIRLWRVHRGQTAPVMSDDEMISSYEQTLTNKAHTFEASGSKYSVAFEALLLGHEDWIYTVAWIPHAGKMQLLSASADNSLVIWEPDPVSGVWLSVERMGEVSTRKGSTSATGSTGGFWIGLWSPDGREVVTLARTGSWRAWRYDEGLELWMPVIGVSGHVRSVNDIQWEVDGRCLLSTSSDQTTRLYARWIRDGLGSWHEFSRPQIHGYDLNCIGSLGPARFISGADEKLLRVFNEPKAIAQLLGKLGDFRQSVSDEMPDTANIPVLGLSNKAGGEDIGNETINEFNDGNSQPPHTVSLDLDHPPLEYHLARHTLWPEHEKLYGHGYEISAVAASHDRSLVATACKASSIDHAVVRLYDTTDWHEIKPSLTAHSLTITSLCFSADDRYLLSVGRDRQWAVFQRSETEPSIFTLFASNPKGHSRMILGAAWAPVSQPSAFATAGRDKVVKIWQMEDRTFVCKSTISMQNPITAVSFLPTKKERAWCLAIGEDNGGICLYEISDDGLQGVQSVVFDKAICPSKAITKLAWNPAPLNYDDGDLHADESRVELAVASEDTSVRIYSIEIS